MEALDTNDTLPPGPYSVGLTKGPGNYRGVPYTVVCGDGRAISGHIPSKAIAEAIVRALHLWEAAQPKFPHA